MRLLIGLMAVWLAGPALAADTPAAKRTRTELLKRKVRGEFQNRPLREVLKAYASEVEEQVGRRVMWTYLDGVDAKQPVTVSGNGRPLDVVLAEVLKAAGLDSVVVREDDHPRDGWVWVVTPAEAKAYKAFVGAVDDLADGKPAECKQVLGLIVDKYPATKTRAKAEALLEKLNK